MNMLLNPTNPTNLASCQDVCATYPLTAGQQALWYIQQQAPDSTAYHGAFVCRIHSAVDLPVLRSAFQTLVDRHAMLRTTITLQQGELCQQGHAQQTVDFAQIALTDTDAEVQQQAVTDAYRQPFDLAMGPLLRVRLFTIAPDAHILLIVVHHIIFDGWSMQRLLAELERIYPALCQGVKPGLPPAPPSYTEYLAWQSSHLAQQGDTLFRHWQELVADAPPLLALSTDLPRPPQQRYVGDAHFFQINPAITRGLQRLVETEGATLPMVLLTAFALLLHRYTGQDDLLVGVPAAGRTQNKFADTLGYFTNLLPVRSRLVGNPTFRQLLAQTKQAAFQSQLLQDYPFSQLVQRLGIPRDPSYPPLLQATCGVQIPVRGLEGFTLVSPDAHAHNEWVEWAGMMLSPFHLPQQLGQVDLNLDIEVGCERITAALKYNSDLFDESTIVRLAGHFAVLLEGIVNQPEQAVFHLPMLTEAEYQQIVYEWNDTSVDFGPAQTIHALFEQQVARTPDAVAVVADFGLPILDFGLSDAHAEIQNPKSKIQNSLTYAELNARANQLAHHLITLGVQADTLVAVMMERSIEMVVSLLAVLKAGGAYVPIDPTYPPERIAFMLQDCAAPILLTQSHLDFAQTMEEGNGEGRRQSIAVDQLGRQLAAYPTGNPQTQTAPAHLAYVIYTSGSTGKPKGIAISHHNVTNFLAAMQQQPGLRATDRLLAVTTISFDIAVLELYLPLVVGASVMMANDEDTSDPERLMYLLQQYQMTIVQATPATWSMLTAHPRWRDCVPMTVLCGGETFPLPLAERLLETGHRVWNLYGPTEATVWVSAGRVEKGGQQVPIAAPIANTTFYILGESGRVIPVGVAGELYIGGAQLARGYLKRPELTAERFIEHPVFGRLYKTGDLCRWLPDGNIEYIGRTDFQVKLRGFRIELGEIENLLLAQEGVREAVVVAREETSGDKRLVAYVVLRDAGNASPIPALRSALQAKLPEYMMPSAFVRMEAMPLTPNGKLDRRALPAPEYGETQNEFVAPRTALEAQLAAIWQAVLGIEQAGVYDNFFALGGHSLLATQVISRIRTQLQCEVPLKWLFETPQIAAFAQRLSGQEANLRSHNRPLVPALVRSGELPYRFPLSFAQQRLWFLDQLETNSGFYNIPMQLHLTGALDIAALAASFCYLQARHESLRTRFATVDGEAVQVIESPSVIALTVQPVASAAAADALARQEAILPFNLQRGPLWRVHLLQVAEREHRLLLTLHHSISDGWSNGVLVKELSQAYRSYRLGEPPNLPALPIQYADFAVWQRNYLRAETLHRHLGYWQAQLKGAPALLELPTDRPRPPVQSHRGAHHAFPLSAELTRQLHQLAQTKDATLFMVLLAAFNVLLARYSRQTDLVVGSPIANRNQAELEGLIGFFVNTLVLRTQLDDNPSFYALLERVRQTTLAAYEHQDLPFEQLVDALQPERSLSYSPLFQVMFVLQNADLGEWRLPNLTARMAFADFPFAKFDLTLNLVESEAGLLGMLEYNSDLFDEATIARMAGHFAVLLEGIVNQPAQPVFHLPMLTEAEYQQIVYEWNDTAVDFGPAQTIHALFEQQVARTPDAVAVIMAADKETNSPLLPLSPSPCLTYAQLNARANQLAHHLLALGVRPNSVVGVAAERSVYLIVAILGALKAGAAYLPIDPAHPGERIAYLLQDSQTNILLTTSALAHNLSGTSVTQIQLDTLDLGAYAITNPVTTVQPASAAYLIYTSGSTGQPKGVLMPHQAIWNLCQWQHQILPDPARTLQQSPITFDVACQELFTCWHTGGTLLLIQEELRRDLPALLDFLEAAAVERIFLPYVLLNALAEQATTQHRYPATLRDIITAGEQLIITPAITRWLEGLPAATLHNHYGPTETHVATAYTLENSPAQWPIWAPIGRPIANMTTYLLDDGQTPVPIGIPGELYIGGAQLACGYHNRPALTTERFIHHPQFGRLYKTGDLCRWLPDGNIEYIGRTDFQVKLRGFRIELGEIENALLAQEGVREAVVVAREERASDKRLVAYVVLRDAGNASPIPALRSALQAKLPEYMIPSAFVVMEAMPLTPNGKLDRRALPAPEYGETQDEFVAPRTALEAQLAAIWQAVLQIEQAGVYDNFFALGGHSLLATQVISRIRTQLQCEVPLKWLFEAPQIAALAQRLSEQEASLRSHNRPLVPALVRSGALPYRFPLSFAQQRLWFLDQLETNSGFYNIPMQLHLSGALDIAALAESFSYLQTRHESLRTRFATVDGEAVQVIESPSPITLAVQPVASAAAADALASQEAVLPFKLHRGPLWRVHLLQVAESEHRLLLTLHHSISDGWSNGVLVKELSQAYRSYLLGEPPNLPALPIQYADFAVWQRSYLRAETLHRHLNYWQAHLRDAPALLELPTDRPRPPVQSHRGAHHAFQLSAELTHQLQQLAQTKDATLFMVLLAAFNVLLARYSRQTDLVVGSPIANRNQAELEGLIGLFVNTLVLRTQLDDNPSFHALLERVRQTTLAAYEHQDLPFEQLVEALQPERSLSYSPLFQVMFVLQNADLGEWSLPNLTVRMAFADFPFAKFDLTLNLVESDTGLLGMLEYNSDLFDESTIVRLAGHFAVLLEGIVNQPAQPVFHLPMLTEAEYQQIVYEWNDTAVDFASPQTFHALFEQQVARTPDAIALVFEEDQLTYAELNARANQLAHHLIALGVKPDTLVALAMERSIEMVVSLLAVLKAGGAYVPIDPGYPAERIHYMLADSAAPILLTQSHLSLAQEATQQTQHLITVDKMGAQLAAQSIRNPQTVTAPADLAYVIYTSGSTGQPKGVLIEHQGLVHLVEMERRTFNPHVGDRILQFASFGFDASLWDLIMALMTGATLYVASQEERLSTTALAEMMRREAITIATLTPSVLALLSPKDFPALSMITATGEACPVEIAERWAPTVRFFNGYGPTEATVGATLGECFADGRKPPIGRPFLNKQIYLLDDHLQPVPIGIPGMIYIGGAGLARGYLNQPDLTAAAFIPNPFGEGKLYKTGDYARYLPDGNLDFIGRRDHQIKLRGQRIELGEIESALLSQEGVREAVVLVREDISGYKQLVAYLVGEADSEYLRQWLAQRLPAYMMPSAFVRMEAMPLTPNGKLDRRALPAPEYGETQDEFVAPRTALEAQLAAIWQAVLGIERVGVYDNFFALGGHSLLATQVVSRIRQALAIELPLRRLFATPTIAALTDYIDTVQLLQTRQPLPATPTTYTEVRL